MPIPASDQKVHLNSGDGKQAKSQTRRPPPKEEGLMKHQLQNTWTLWYFKNDKTKKWEENQKKVTDFSTVEDFWALYNHIEEASRLAQGCDYSLFKGEIEPMWEDPENKEGGRWVINLDKKQREELSHFWQEIMFLLIGEAFGENSQYVNGAVVNVRFKGDKIGVWLGKCGRNVIAEIGRLIKEKLGIKVPINFEFHDNTKHKTSSATKPAFCV